MLTRLSILVFFFIISISIPTSTTYAANKVIYGYSSWYGDRFHGRKTANGEIYDMNKMTAAHRKLPFGTYIKVTNLKNNKSVIVKVNDRGPYKPNRIIDVSRAAAQKLDFINQGLTRVRIEVLGKYYDSEDGKGVEEHKNVSKDGEPQWNEESLYGQSKVVIPSFRIKRNKTNKTNKSGQGNNKRASKTIRSTKTKGAFRVLIIKTQESVKKSNKRIYKIQLGAYSNVEYAVVQQRKYAKKGIKTILCVFRGEGKYFRLLSKKSFKSQKKASIAIKKLSKRGVNSFVIGF